MTLSRALDPLLPVLAFIFALARAFFALAIAALIGYALLPVVAILFVCVFGWR